MKHGILFWCLNEIEALKVVCDDLKSSIDVNDSKYVILFVDGNSSDGSIDFLRAAGFWVHVQENTGMRSAIVEGVKILLSQNVDSITFAQPDGNCDLTKIYLLLQEFQNVDSELIIASRYLYPAKSLDDTLISKLGNFYFTKLISIISGFKYTDSMVGYRTYSSKLVNNFKLLDNLSFWKIEKILKTSLGWDPLISLLAPLYAVNIKELPISEPKRIGGVVKKNTIKWGLGYTFQALYVLIYRIKIKADYTNSLK